MLESETPITRDAYNFPRPRPKEPLQQTCKACGQPDKFDFSVPDEIWMAVVPEALQTRAVCLYCFDEFARQQGVAYADHLTYLYFAGTKSAFGFSKDWGVSIDKGENHV